MDLGKRHENTISKNGMCFKIIVDGGGGENRVYAVVHVAVYCALTGVSDGKEKHVSGSLAPERVCSSISGLWDLRGPAILVLQGCVEVKKVPSLPQATASLV